MLFPRRNHFVFLVALASVAVGAVGISGAVDYFPTEPGPVFYYGTTPVTISEGWNGGFSRAESVGEIGTVVTYFGLDENEDVLLQGQGYLYLNMPSPELVEYPTSLTYLDFPLESGKTWTSTTARPVLWDEPWTALTLTGSVQGPTTVTVPAGEFRVIVVTLDYQFEGAPELDYTDELWLHQELGPVGNLVSWSGITSDQAMPWGAVKALYH